MAMTVPTHPSLRRRLRNPRGFSLVELLTTVAILGIVVATALPHIEKQREKTNTYLENMIADLRTARAGAITSGAHFSFNWQSLTHYQVQRLKQSGSSWVLDKVTRDINLPSNLMVWMYPTAVEFNTRGIAITATYPVYVYLWDTKYGASHALSVWPSGQVYDEF